MQTTDPWIQSLRPNTRLLLVLFPFLIVGELFAAISNLLTHHAITLIPITVFVFALFELFAYLVLLARRRTWKYHEQTRLRALSGDSTLLAPSQPAKVTPTSQPITLPLVIETRQKIGLFFLVIILFLAALFLVSALIFFALLFTITPTHSSPNTPIINISLASLTTFGSVFLAVVIIIFILALVFRKTTIHRIEATEQGIIVTYQGITRPLTWDSLRFFAVSPSTRPNRLLYYELSSDHNYLNWLTLQSPSLTRSGYYRPTTPFDQYQRDTHTLLALIQQKTNLPLYQLPPFNTLFPPKTQ